MSNRRIMQSISTFDGTLAFMIRSSSVVNLRFAL